MAGLVRLSSGVCDSFGIRVIRQTDDDDECEEV